MSIYFDRRLFIHEEKKVPLLSFIELNCPELNENERETFEHIICAFIRSHGAPIKISLTSGHYSKSIYSRRPISRKEIDSLILKLHKRKLILFVKGHRSKRYSKLTTLICPKSLLKLVNKYTLSDVTFSYDNEICFLKSKTGALKEFSPREKTRKSRRELQRFYENSKNRVTKDGQELSLFCYRVFNDSSFCKGGRVFTKAQFIPKIERKSLRIDGKGLCEVDFKHFHLQILAHKSDATFDIDIYNEFGFLKRDQAKKGIMILLNSKSRHRASQALRKHIGLSSEEISHFINGVIYHLPFIEQYLFCQYGLKLQNMESNVMMEVISRANKLNLCFIPNHDGLLCPCSQTDIFKDLLNSACKKILRFEPDMKIKRV